MDLAHTIMRFDSPTQIYRHPLSMAPLGQSTVQQVAWCLNAECTSSIKHSLNVDSPAFTPLSPNLPAVNKSLGISPRAAAAAVFTPGGSGMLADPVAKALRSHL